MPIIDIVLCFVVLRYKQIYWIPLGFFTLVLDQPYDCLNTTDTTLKNMG